MLTLIPIFLVVSCQREQEWEGAPDIRAEVESEQKTRTSLSVDGSGAGTIYWNPSDKIDVFYGTKKAQYTSQNASDAIAATFKTNATLTDSDVSSTNIWGLYPSNSSSSCTGSSITTTLPSTQYGVPNTFDKDIFPAVARSSSTSLEFYNVCGGIKFNLAYDDIKRITFRGNNNENLAGTVSISFVDNLPKATIVNGVKEITLTPKTGTTFTKGADYYFILLPGTLSAGFTITFTATDGTTGTLNYIDNPITIHRSIFGKKGNVDVYATFADERQPDNVIYYTSSNGKIVTPNKTDVFGANIVSNEYVGGRGIITFDGKVTSIGSYAFSYCSSLTSIDIPNSVTSFGYYSFSDCSGLTSINIPNSATSIGHAAFYGCSGLTSIIIPNSVTSIGTNPFDNCSGLLSIIVDNGNPVYDSRNGCNAIIETSTNELISGCENTIIPNSVTSIGSYAFYGCSGLTSLEIPNSVTSIGYAAFYDCSGLTSIDIPNSVTSIGSYAFRGCSGLISLEIPNSVTSIGWLAFYDCSGLTSIIVFALTPPALEFDAFTNTDNCPFFVPAQSFDAFKTADRWSEYADRIFAMGEFYEAVDLGLPSGVKWATCNVGASSPEGYGDYFAWGETETKSNYSWSTYEWCNGRYSTLTKYCNNSSYGHNGFSDNKTVLDLEDDAAHVNWGGSWRMPTDAEWTELRENCAWTWTTQNGVKGYRVTSKKTGYTDKSIFLPAAGNRYDAYLSGVGTDGDYWSSSLNTDGPSDAWNVYFFSDSIFRDSLLRYGGFSVRPVYGQTLDEVNYRRADSLALVKIHTIADGANWKESRRWTLTEPMDKWPGIKLNEEGRVVELSITNGTVTTVEWEIPEELADLTELGTLQIVGSKLKGQIPEFLYGMAKLAKIRLNGNNLTGAISDKISQLTELTELYVNENKQLGGSLPAAMGNLKKLVGLNVAKTAITGAVPAELSGCESLQNFMAYQTKFTSIPDNWDQWPALKIVQLYGNEGLTGPLPASLGNAKLVTSLQLKNCNFTGNIPESYGNLPSTCNQLFLNGNQLKGVIPAAVQAHPKFQATSGWKYEASILPQQEGFGLTLE